MTTGGGPVLDPQGNRAAAYLTWVDASGAQQLTFDCVLSEDWSDDAAVTEHPVEKGPDISDNVRPKLRTCKLKIFATNEPIGSNSFAVAVPMQNPVDILSPTWKRGDGQITYDEWDSHLLERELLGTGAGVAGTAVGGAIGVPVLGAVAAVAGAAVGSLLLTGEKKQRNLQTDAGLDPRRDSLVYVTSDFFNGGQYEDYVAATLEILRSLKQSSQLLTVVPTKQDAVPNMVIDSFSHHRDAETGTGAEITLGLKEIKFVSTVTVPAPAPTVPRAAAPVSKGNQNPQNDDDPSKKKSVLVVARDALHRPRP